MMILLIISKVAVLLWVISSAVLVFYPKIRLPKYFDFILMLSIIFGLALLVREDYSVSPAETLFNTTASIVFALFARSIYMWAKKGSNPHFLFRRNGK